jgi:hypothetical protein
VNYVINDRLWSGPWRRSSLTLDFSSAEIALLVPKITFVGTEGDERGREFPLSLRVGVRTALLCPILQRIQQDLTPS